MKVLVAFCSVLFLSLSGKYSNNTKYMLVLQPMVNMINIYREKDVLENKNVNEK